MVRCEGVQKEDEDAQCRFVCPCLSEDKCVYVCVCVYVCMVTDRDLVPLDEDGGFLTPKGRFASFSLSGDR